MLPNKIAPRMAMWLTAAFSTAVCRYLFVCLGGRLPLRSLSSRENNSIYTQANRPHRMYAVVLLLCRVLLKRASSRRRGVSKRGVLLWRGARLPPPPRPFFPLWWRKPDTPRHRVCSSPPRWGKLTYEYSRVYSCL